MFLYFVPRGRVFLQVLIALTLLLVGCPRRFDPAAAPPITSRGGRAGDVFEGCRRLFEGGKALEADACFARFASHHATDPLVPSARLYRGRGALSRGDLSTAKAFLEPLARGLTEGAGHGGKTTRGGAGTAPSPSATSSGHEGNRALVRSARYYLGLTLVRLGDHRRVIQLLAPLETAVQASSFPALAASLAVSREALGQRVAACRTLDRLYRETDRPVERLHARLGLERMVLAATAAQMKRLLAKAPRGGLLRGLCARRLVTDAEGRGDFAAAQILRAQNAEALRYLGATAARTRRRVGVLLPEGGPYRRVGEMAIVGLALASGAFSATSKPLDLVIRDSGTSAAAAARALITTEHVMALVGVFDPRQASAVAHQAARARVPFLALAPGGQGGPWRLQMLPSSSARATALVHHLVHEVAHPRVLALVPDSRFGRRSLRVFGRVLRRAGGRLVGVERYRAAATSFVRIGKRAARRSLDAIFVADSARRLALIAPALAQAGLWARPRGVAAPKGGRAYRLLATADGLSSRLLRSAGRYVQGAVLAPGFYPDPTSPRLGPLLRAYERAAGHAPSLVEAFAHDAIVALRAALATGARTPAALRRSLRRS
ncbi:MAG: ABC transporter substrate-binding protein, partial [Deltaproteobacteria bacterium]|nr:ABC transporter substrate-binding protein [Deltaproteobacteria bacterium]